VAAVVSAPPRPGQDLRPPRVAAPGAISGRAHTASLVAVFLALALGVLIGGELLHGTVVHDLHKQVRDANAATDRARADATLARTQQGRAATFATGVTAPLLPGKLDQTAVAIVTLPGTATADVTRVSNAITAAGGHLTGVVTLTDAFGQSSSEQLLTDVSSKVPSTGAAPPPDPLGAAATILTVALAPTQGAAATGGSPSRTLDAFATAGLLRTSAPITENAATIVLLGGAAPDTSASATATALAEAFGRRAVPAVLSAPGPAALTGGTVAAVRADKNAAAVSTTDDLDLGQGPGASVLALAATKGGHPGAFGEGPGASAPLAPH
jgi:hypothetical protein